MRIGRAHGRLVIIDGDGVVDAATASGGEFSADPDRAFEVWGRADAGVTHGLAGLLWARANRIDVTS